LKENSVMNLSLKHDDGRKPVSDLYHSFSALEGDGWIREEITISEREFAGGLLALPILSFRTGRKGRAIWLIAGIHGEEPAGPNAIAEGIDYIRELGMDHPVVLLPLCNPLGYANNWRYLNMPKWTEGKEEHSVGDSEHVLPDLKNPGAPRRQKALTGESAALTGHVLRLVKDYPPVMSIDLHEDSLLDEGYIYSQGRWGVKDRIAGKIVDIISSSGVAINMNGKTRFCEQIVKGIVTTEGDGSIDDLLSSRKIILNGKVIEGPGAMTAIVVETPAGAMPLEKRKSAHLAILKNLKGLLEDSGTTGIEKVMNS